MPAWRDKISDDDVKLLGRTCGAGARHCREREGWLDPQMDGEGAIP
jgi:hypothetical protein